MNNQPSEIERKLFGTLIASFGVQFNDGFVCLTRKQKQEWMRKQSRFQLVDVID